MVSRLLLWLLLFSSPAIQAGELHDPFPDIAQSYLVEIDGSPLWQRHAGRRLAPASLSKLMTALLLVEHNKLDAPVTVDRAAAHESGIGIRPGEQFRARDLLAAMLIASANDACHALADFDAGSETRFVQQMNRRAQQLGLHDTHYSNACGRDASGHYSSARDLAKLSHELLKHPEITALTSRRGARIATQDGKRSYSFASRNALVKLPGVLGLKTGYSRRAGRCQVIYAERGSHKVLLVILHGRRWGDAAEMLELAFEQALGTR